MSLEHRVQGRSFWRGLFDNVTVADIACLSFAAVYYYIVVVRLDAGLGLRTMAPALLLLLIIRTQGSVRYWLAFFALFFFYETMRAVADDINTRIDFDRVLRLEYVLFMHHYPVILLQKLRHPLLDVTFFSAYSTHFINILIPAIFLWRRHATRFRGFVTAVIVTVYLGFIIFIVFPVAPPRLALAGTSWITQSVASWAWPTIVRGLNSNPFAAMPSMHVALPFLVFLYFRRFHRTFAIIYGVLCVLIGVGAVYLGEHYAVDIIGGLIVATIGYYIARKFTPGADEPAGAIRRTARV